MTSGGMNTRLLCFGSSAPLPLVAAMVVGPIELSVLSASVSGASCHPALGGSHGKKTLCAGLCQNCAVAYLFGIEQLACRS